MENALVDTELLVPSYGSIVKIPSTVPAPPHTRESLSQIDCYMGDNISTVQGGTERQQRVFVCTDHALKYISPYYQESPNTQRE